MFPVFINTTMIFRTERISPWHFSQECRGDKWISDICLFCFELCGLITPCGPGAVCLLCKAVQVVSIAQNNSTSFVSVFCAEVFLSLLNECDVSFIVTSKKTKSRGTTNAGGAKKNPVWLRQRSRCVSLPLSVYLSLSSFPLDSADWQLYSTNAPHLPPPFLAHSSPLSSLCLGFVRWGGNAQAAVWVGQLCLPACLHIVHTRAREGKLPSFDSFHTPTDAGAGMKKNFPWEGFP